jgi:hypothetical protein
MELKNEHELNVTRGKLRLLEERLQQSRTEHSSNPRSQALSQRSLQRLINQMKEEIVRYQAHHPVQK